MADLPLEVGGHPFGRQMATGLSPSSRPRRQAAGLAGTCGARYGPGCRGRRLTPVQHVGVGETPLGNQTDIFRHVRVRRAGPLAVDDLVVVVGISGIGRFHLVIAM